VDAAGLNEALGKYFGFPPEYKSGNNIKDRCKTEEHKSICGLITEMKNISVYAYIYNTLYNHAKTKNHDSSTYFKIAPFSTNKIRIDIKENTIDINTNSIGPSKEIILDYSRKNPGNANGKSTTEKITVKKDIQFNNTPSFKLNITEFIIDDTLKDTYNASGEMAKSLGQILNSAPPSYDADSYFNEKNIPENIKAFVKFFKAYLNEYLNTDPAKKFFTFTKSKVSIVSSNSYDTHDHNGVTYTLYNRSVIGGSNEAFIINTANLTQEINIDNKSKTESLNKDFKTYFMNGTTPNPEIKKFYDNIINEIFNKFCNYFRDIKTTGDDAFQLTINAAVNRIKGTINYSFEKDLESIFGANSVDPDQLLKLVVFTMDLYNIKVQELCTHLTIKNTGLTATFDMIDIYGFEKKMSTKDTDSIDTTSFVINLVNDKVMRVFLKFLLQGLENNLIKYKKKTDKDREFEEKLEVSVSQCKAYNTFVESIINESMVYPLKGFDDKIINSECLIKKYVLYVNTLNKNLDPNTDQNIDRIVLWPTKSTGNFKKVLHSTRDGLEYIDDIYSKIKMYNITQALQNTPISNITPKQILELSTEKNIKREMLTSCKSIALEFGVSEQNILLKTIQDIDTMLVERKELEGYVFIKCIKALSIKKTSVQNNPYNKSTDDSSYYMPMYDEPVVTDQLKNLGLEIIGKLEPKLVYTIFNKTNTVTRETHIENLITYIKKTFYTEATIIFETKKKEEPNKINLKVYAQGKGSFTIKKFLENIFSLYGIIPHEK
jgi:hypothetical protein